MNNLRSRTIVMSLIYAFVLSQANATSFSVSGYLYRVNSALTGEFSVGESFSLMYEFNPLAVDMNVDTQRGEYRTADGGATLTIGDYHVSAQGVVINVSDNLDNFIPPDRYSPSSIFNTQMRSVFIGNDVAGLFPYFWGVELDDIQGTEIVSDALPLSPLDLSSFENRTFELAFASAVTPDVAFGVQRVYGYVTNMSAVPEPGLIGLWGVGLLAIFGATRVKKKSNAELKLKSNSSGFNV